MRKPIRQSGNRNPGAGRSANRTPRRRRITRKSSSLSSRPQDGAGQEARRPWRTSCLGQHRRSGGKCRPASTRQKRSLQQSLLAERHST
ncbi:hypothetical protein IG608_20135 [Pectobacterium sp. A113-S21-F16]|nr:hypothetical protein [Pectobacterium quasiaquaticum]